MKRVCLLSIFIFFIVIFSSCGIDNGFGFGNDVHATGEVIEREYEYDFNKIEVKNIHVKQKNTTNGVNLDIIASETKKVVVKMQESLFDNITLEVQQVTPLFQTREVVEGKFKAYGKSTDNYLTKEIHIYIYGYSLNELDFSCVMGNISGKCLNDGFIFNINNASNIILDEITSNKATININNASFLKANNMTLNEVDLKISNASKAMVNIDADNLKLILSNASNLNIEGGNVNFFDVSVTNASKLDAQSLNVKKASLVINGASSAKLSLCEEISYNVKDGSSLHYLGAVKVIEGTKDISSTVEGGN